MPGPVTERRVPGLARVVGRALGEGAVAGFLVGAVAGMSVLVVPLVWSLLDVLAGRQDAVLDEAGPVLGHMVLALVAGVYGAVIGLGLGVVGGVAAAMAIVAVACVRRRGWRRLRVTWLAASALTALAVALLLLAVGQPLPVALVLAVVAGGIAAWRARRVLRSLPPHGGWRPADVPTAG
ncbi:hypothetical protein [Aquipuribacter nitratireducens]|uniref:Uncharacterized protein n=1 Tax=Aquipuribacter nitratireducens TaxID=650104 RepID=A0ABW0GMV6_9MICO